jgi:hypothetical protein
VDQAHGALKHQTIMQILSHHIMELVVKEEDEEHQRDQQVDIQTQEAAAEVNYLAMV